MLRLLLTLVLASTCPLASLAEDAPSVKLADVKLDLAKLKNWGTQTYSYGTVPAADSGRTIAGTWVMKTELVEKSYVLTDKLELTIGAQKLSQTLVQQCRADNELSPIQIECKGEGPETRNFTLEFGAGRALATIRSGKRGTQKEFEIPEKVLTDSAVWRIVPLLPREKGAEYTVPHWLEVSEINLKSDFTIKSLGPESIDRGAHDLQCDKFEVSGQGIRPFVVWVKDGLLERALIDGRKLLERTPPEE